MELLGEVLADEIGFAFEPFDGLLENNGLHIHQLALIYFLDQVHFLRNESIHLLAVAGGGRRTYPVCWAGNLTQHTRHGARRLGRALV